MLVHVIVDVFPSKSSNDAMPRSPEQIPLHHLFAHNAWATEKLLEFCEQLTPEQWNATAAGAVGSVFETIHHLVQAEGGYLDRLAPDLTPSDWEHFLPKSLEAVRTRANQMAMLWREYTARDPDAAEIRRKVWPDVTHEFPAYMEITQALFHSHTHREQACMVLSSLGLQPPDLQPLAWADANGVLQRIR